MAITKDKKQTIIEKVKTLTDKGEVLVFVNFHGLSVVSINELRQELAALNLSYLVAKKTLIKLALKDQAINGELPPLEGEVALAAISPEAENAPEALSVPKSIYEFQKRNPDKLKIIGGIFEGEFVDEVTMNTLAQIPGREVLLGQLAYMLNWPITSLAMSVKQIAEQKS